MPFADDYVGISPVTSMSMGGQYGTLTATGSTQGNAALVTASLSVVNGADGTKGVILNAQNVGDSCWIWNNSSSALKVYPTGAAGLIAIPGTSLGSAAAAVSIAANQCAEYRCIAANTWLALKSTT